MSQDEKKPYHPPVDEYWGVNETEGYRVRDLGEALPHLRTPLHGLATQAVPELSPEAIDDTHPGGEDEE